MAVGALHPYNVSHIYEHSDAMEYIRNLGCQRWVAYFDLLGIRALLAEGKELQVFVAYEAALREFQNHSEWAPELQHAWFSDTFIIVAPDDSQESFKRVEYMSRLFAYSLLSSRVPFRGAISCGQFYADFNERVFFGSALVEACEHGEGQDWVGVVLCPSAIQRLSALGVQLNTFYYVPSDVPWKSSARSTQSDAAVDGPHHNSRHLTACVVGNWLHVNFKNPCIPIVKEMMARCGAPNVKVKYERTARFLEENERNWNANHALEPSRPLFVVPYRRGARLSANR